MLSMHIAVILVIPILFANAGSYVYYVIMFMVIIVVVAMLLIMLISLSMF